VVERVLLSVSENSIGKKVNGELFSRINYLGKLGL